MATGGGEGDAASVFKWTDEDTECLINWCIAKESLFTGKRNAAIKGFEAFIHEKNLTGKVSAAWVKKKWENLKQKYKDLKCPQSGVSTDPTEATAASWKWYGVMDAALGSKPSITPPVLIQSGNQDDAIGSSPSVAGPSDVACGKRKRGSGESDLLIYLRELEERDAKREEQENLREERREREFEERERRKEEESKERAEEARRREEEFRVRMELRDEEMRREAAAREERFISLMEVLAKTLMEK